VYTSIGGTPQRCTYGYDCAFAGDGTATRVTVLDLTDRSAPRVTRTLELTGSLMTARRVGNAVHTVHAQNVVGKRVLITGAGLIGLMAVPVAKAAGAAAVYVTDLNPGRLDVARELGADLALDAREDPVDRLLAATDGAGVDVLLEMSGAAPAIDQGFKALRPGGEAAILGLPSRPIQVDWAAHVVTKGATVRGIYGRRIWDTWHQMRALLATGAVNLAPLITHRFPLTEFQAGFDAMRSGQSGKVILLP
jgi:threonine 3-dehydrogenase